jgi:hypothetical protein
VTIIARKQDHNGPIEICIDGWPTEITDWTALKLIADLSNMLACRPRPAAPGSTQEKLDD